MHDAAMDVGQSEVTAGMAVGEPLMVEAKQVQHRRVQVVHVHLVHGRLEAVAGEVRRRLANLMRLGVFAAVVGDRAVERTLRVHHPLGGLAMLHAYQPVGCVTEHRFNEKWERRIAGCYRFRDSAFEGVEWHK